VIEVTQPGTALLQRDGSFVLGCNYWASHAGTAMWTDWRPEVVADDFAKLAAHRLEVVRVFPNWRDFQPMHQLRGGCGQPVEMRFGEAPLPPDPVGQAGVSAVMLSRFRALCGIAEERGLKLIASLVTGFMSGRLFVPPALEGLNPISSPECIVWQIRYVRTLVEDLRNQPAILAWDLGNECNVMGHTTSRAEAYVWTASITNAIKAADASRPVISGMHSLSAPVSSIGKLWIIDDQAELTDILTTHPYPYWTRHTRADAVDVMRTSLHPTAETRYYADIGGKPCFAEETGTMGPMIAGDTASAAFARVNLLSLWANDCKGFLWWCAHDQTSLAHAPYDWLGVEAELGLLREDGSPKPVMLEMQAFREFLATLPFQTLPRRKSDAVCLVTHDQDDWAVAFSSYVLAKQAKLEITFRHIEQPLPESPVYLLPSLTGPRCVPRGKWLQLLQRVRDGAVLYLSLGDGIVPNFNEVAGVEVVARSSGRAGVTTTLEDGTVLDLVGAETLSIEPKGAEVLGRRSDNGAPAFWHHRLGRGTVVVFAAPIEAQAALIPGSLDGEAKPFWRIYETVAALAPPWRWIRFDCHALAVTEHELDGDRRLVIVINHSGTPRSVPADFSAGISLESILRGSFPSHSGAALAIGPHEGAVAILTKT